MPGDLHRISIGRATACHNRRIHDRVQAVFRESSPDAAFAFLSGKWRADQTAGRSRLAFARYKGQAEKALLAAGFPRVHLFRPAYIYPVEPEGTEFQLPIDARDLPVFRVFFPNQLIRADELARAMVDVAVRGTEEHPTMVLENRDIRAIAKSPQILSDGVG